MNTDRWARWARERVSISFAMLLMAIVALAASAHFVGCSGGGITPGNGDGNGGTSNGDGDGGDGSDNGDGTNDGNGDGGNGGTTTEYGTITGAVVDALDPSTPVGNAYVYVPIGGGRGTRQDDTIGDTTDALGAFDLPNVPAGPVKLIIEPPAGSTYVKVEVEIDLPANTTVRIRVTVISQESRDLIGTLAIDPASAQVAPGGTVQFVALLRSDLTVQVFPTWVLRGAIGSMDDNGLFTAGATPGQGLVVATLGDLVAEAPVEVVQPGSGGGPGQPVIETLTADPLDVVSGASVQLECVATDPDGDSLTYTWHGSYGSVDGTGPDVTWIAPNFAGVFAIQVTVDDGASEPVSQSVDVTVTNTTVIVE